MDDLTDYIADVLVLYCPTEDGHSRLVAGLVVDKLGMKEEVRDGKRRWVTEWMDPA